MLLEQCNGEIISARIIQANIKYSAITLDFKSTTVINGLSTKYNLQMVVFLLFILEMVDHLLSCFYCPDNFYNLFANPGYSPFECIYYMF